MKGPQANARLTFDPDKVIKFSLIFVFMRSHRCNLSCFQCSVYLSLCLGLPLPAMHTCSCKVFPCGTVTAFSVDGAHALNCPRCASRGWSGGHDGLVYVLAEEARRVGISASADPGPSPNGSVGPSS